MSSVPAERPDPPARRRVRRSQHTSVEKWFADRGLAGLLNGTPYQLDITRRAARPLVVALLISMLTIVPGSTVRPGLGLLIGLVGIVAVWVVGNLLRKQRPLSPITRVGWFEMLAFVLMPVLVVAATPRDVAALDSLGLSAGLEHLLAVAAVAIIQVVILVVVMATVRWALIASLVWLGRRIMKTFTSSGTAMARTLPMLLLVTTFSWFTAEMWQSIGTLQSWGFLGLLALFLGLGFVFGLSRPTYNLDELATFEDEPSLHAALARTPMPQATLVSYPASCPLDAKARRSIAVTSTASTMVLATSIGFLTFLFFLLLGWLTVNQPIAAAWSNAKPHVIFTLTTWRHAYAMTWEHVRVAAFMGAFSAFYYSVASATDASLREGLEDAAEEGVREACALRLVLTESPSAGSPRAEVS